LKSKSHEIIDMLSLLGQITISMLVPIFICTFGAIWLGRRWDISWLAVVGFFIGALAGFRSVYVIIKKYIRNSNDQGTKKNE